MDQDPILMQHFRLIRTVEVNWKDQQQALSGVHGSETSGDIGGAPGENLEELLNQYIEEQGDGDDATW